LDVIVDIDGKIDIPKNPACKKKHGFLLVLSTYMLSKLGMVLLVAPSHATKWNCTVLGAPLYAEAKGTPSLVNNVMCKQLL